MSHKKRRMATINEADNEAVDRRWIRWFSVCFFLVASVLTTIQFKQPLLNAWQQIYDVNFSDDFEMQVTENDENQDQPADFTKGWRVALHKETEFVSAMDLEKYLKERIDSSFFSLGAEEALETLIEHPWVKNASARKVWPNTLLVDIEEHQPWLNLNKQQLVSSEGVIFTPGNIDEFAALPILGGAFGELGDLLDMYDFFSKQMPSHSYRIAQMKFRDDNGWTLQLENNVELFLGKQDLTERLERFFSIADRILVEQNLKDKSKKKVAYVDLRYQTGVAVGWHKEQPSEQVAQR